MEPERSPTRLDHCVLPVESLEKARIRWTSAGFTVAPDGIHPFGTANCCIYFSDGTFLEPLAVADDQIAKQAASAGNVFVARDQIFRSLQPEGFSALVIASNDAEADNLRFRNSGFGAGDMLSFSRAVVDSEGRRDTAGFELAFAAPAPDGAFAFACQRVAEPAIDRAGLQRHANGTTGIEEIVAVAPQPSSQQAFLSAVLTTDGRETPEGLRFELEDKIVSVVTPRVFAHRFAVECDSIGLNFAAIVFAVDGPAFASWRADAAVAVTRVANLDILPATQGQGVVLAFSTG